MIKKIMETETCQWNIFDDQSRMKMEEGVFLTGLFSLFLLIWINGTLFLTSIKTDLSYRNLGFFTLASLIRCGVTVLSYMMSSETSEEAPNITCHIFGFWHSFLSVYEVECLTHVCIERYVVAKYTTNGWPLVNNHYVLYQVLCLFFAGLYSVPPLLGIGRYGLDFCCTHCVLDMALPDTWDRYIVVLNFLLRSVKSTGFMVVMLFWARQLEMRYDSAKLVKQLHFTQTVILMTVVNLICWMPIVVLRGRTVLSYLLYNGMLVEHSPFCIKWAMWMQGMSPALTTIAIFSTDVLLREKMLNFFNFNTQIDIDKKD